MSIKTKLSAALLALAATTAIATSADAYQARRVYCDPFALWGCGTIR